MKSWASNRLQLVSSWLAVFGARLVLIQTVLQCVLCTSQNLSKDQVRISSSRRSSNDIPGTCVGSAGTAVCYSS